MTEPAPRPVAPEFAGNGADPTRDIRLPRLPGGGAPALPAAWSRPAATPPEAPAEKPPHPSLVESPTDKLRRPGRPRERTLSFSSPEMVRRPVASVQVGRSRRRWPWAVLIALPLLIIVVTGIWLLLLLQAA
jgi:hypothetical protein